MGYSPEKCKYVETERVSDGCGGWRTVFKAVGEFEAAVRLANFDGHELICIARIEKTKAEIPPPFFYRERNGRYYKNLCIGEEETVLYDGVECYEFFCTTVEVR